MKTPFLTLLLAGCLAVAGCGGALPALPIPTVAPSAAPASPTAAPAATTAPQSPLLEQCTLLNSQDLASLFTSAEVVRPTHKLEAAAHPIFTAAALPVHEAACVYYVYHQPGSKAMQMLQVTYWVDAPDAPSPAWDQAWSDAKVHAAQALDGIGDDAFYADGRLSFKSGGQVVTLEVTGNYLDAGPETPDAMRLTIEKQFAQDALGRLP